MLANPNGCKYNCGLDNVILEGYVLGQDRETEERTERINVLHRLIAISVALRPGPLQGSEIRFLRTHLGLTTEELGDRIDYGAGQIMLSELGNWSLTLESDVELRRLIFMHHCLRVSSYAALNGLYATLNPDEFVIRIRPAEPDTYWKRAA